MKLYLGIDGGGTKTTYIIINEKLEIIYEKSDLGTSIDTYDLKTVRSRILSNINSLPFDCFEGVYAGIGGITCQNDVDKVNKIIKSSNKQIQKVNSGNDVTNALEGAINDDGIILISGTGCVSFGKNQTLTHRAGGYGYKEGDLGSSYYLGYSSLCYLAKVIDKRLPKSEFAQALMNEINCFDFSSLAKYFSSFNREEVAQLSKIVTKYSKNKYAKRIINDAVKGALLMIKTVYRECKFKETAKLSLIGGLANANTLYKKSLIAGLPQNIKYVPKKYEASFGSALLAKKL